MSTGLLTTNGGIAAITADLAGGANLVLSHVAWGDANGVPYTPIASQTALVRERYRTTIAAMGVVDGAIVVDAIFPADTNDALGRPSHGFNVAECGLFASDGTLIGVARLDNGFKAAPSSGVAVTAMMRLILAVANPSAITVQIDAQQQIHMGRMVRPYFISVDDVLNAPPATPALGATYVIGAAPTGAWTGFAHYLAQWVGVWVLTIAPVGHLVVDQSEAESSATRYLRRTAGGWVSAIATTDAVGLLRLADQATVDAAVNADRGVTPSTLRTRRVSGFEIGSGLPLRIEHNTETEFTGMTSVVYNHLIDSTLTGSGMICGPIDAGVWEFESYGALTMLIPSAAGTSYRVNIFKNTSPSPLTASVLNSAGLFTASSSTTLILAPGDAVTTRGWHDTGAGRDVGARYLRGRRIGGA